MGSYPKLEIIQTVFGKWNRESNTLKNKMKP